MFNNTFLDILVIAIGLGLLVFALNWILTRGSNNFIMKMALDTSKNLVNELDQSKLNNNLFIDNNILYAEGAMIEIYDIMGRLIVKGDNSVDVALQCDDIMIVKTVYSDNKQFVTKLVNLNK